MIDSTEFFDNFFAIGPKLAPRWLQMMNFTPFNKRSTLLARGVEGVLGDLDHLEKALSEQRRLYRCVGIVMRLFFVKSTHENAE